MPILSELVGLGDEVTFAQIKDLTRQTAPSPTNSDKIGISRFLKKSRPTLPIAITVYSSLD
jgi:hypothetical protein